MTRIRLSKAAQEGISGAVKKEVNTSESYRKLVEEADKRIDEDRFHYAHAYKKAATYLAR